MSAGKLPERGSAERTERDYALMRAAYPGKSLTDIGDMIRAEYREADEESFKRVRAFGAVVLWIVGIILAGAGLALALAMPQATMIELLLAIIVFALL